MAAPLGALNPCHVNIGNHGTLLKEIEIIAINRHLTPHPPPSLILLLRFLLLPSETYDSANGVVAISTKYRFSGMPTPTAYNADGAMYYSYEAGPAHVISISSFYPGGYGASSPLTTWLQSDLAKVDRTKTPWLLVALHAPWYNTNSAHQGDGEAMRAALEPMLIAAKADVVFTGHVHS